MKKILFPVLAFLMVLCLSFVSFPSSALAQQNDPEVCLEQFGLGLGAHNTLPPPYDYLWMGLFAMNISDEHYDGWCIDPVKGIGLEDCFNATVSNATRETPWCEIGYIITNYNATSDNESAAIQLAIWKYYLGGRGSINVTDAPSVEARALAIYDDAQGKSVYGPGLDLMLKEDGEAKIIGGIVSQKFTATITDTGCLEGIAIEFCTDKGSFAPPPGSPVTCLTKLTDGDGKASVTLYWDASLSYLGATVTAHIQGQWPILIQPDDETQPTVIAKPRELQEQIRPTPVGGDVLPIDKVAVLGPWVGLAVLLISGGMAWLRLGQRSA